MTAKHAAPVTERGRQSRQRIVDAAEKVFGEKGYFNASISDITREAGVALGTFYVYFESKHEIFVEVLSTLARVIRRATGAAIQDAANRVEAEERGFSAFFTLIESHPHLYRIVRQGEFIDPGAFRSYYQHIEAGYARRLRAAIEKGEIRDIDPETLVYCLLGIGDLIGMRWPYWERKPVPPHVFDAMMEFVRHGLEPRRNGEPSTKTRRVKRPKARKENRR
jgi:AcrR family transcriptional regulator